VIIKKEVQDIRPFTACAIVKGLKLNDKKIKEIMQIQEKLHITFGRNRKKLAIGIYPLEEIKLPIVYTAKKPNEIKFRPLESTKEMTGLQILSKHPAGKEYGHLLEGKKKFPIFMDSNKEILSMPPIINSHKTGRLIEKTKDVFIECSGFDYNTLSKCLNIIATSLSDMGGQIYSMDLKYENKKKTSPNLNPEEMKLDIDYINQLLGLKLTKIQIVKLLAKMGHGIKGDKVLVPCYRVDILHQIDIAEDIAIAYGYENFKGEIPNVSTVAQENELEIFKSRVAEILVGHRLLETLSYNLTNKRVNNENMFLSEETVELENSLNIDYACLRSWILPGLLKILSDNKNKEYPQNIFEIGKVFNLDKTEETGVKEEEGLGIVLCGPDTDFTKIKQMTDALFNGLGLESEVKEAKHPSFIEGRCGTIKVKGKQMAFLGEINPEVLERFELKMPVVAFELNIEKLFELIN